jgi:NADPH2:quinone reductase
MGAVRVAAHGGPEVMSLERVPLLTAADCSADECVVEVHRAGLNFIGASPGERPCGATTARRSSFHGYARSPPLLPSPPAESLPRACHQDTYFRTGLYGSAEDLPIGMGKEAAGVVVAAGAASSAAVGDRVACLVPSGAYADRLLVRGGACHALPAGVSFDDGAAALLQGMTAHYLACSIPVPSGGGASSASSANSAVAGPGAAGVGGGCTEGLAPGCTALVHAAAGGTGQLLVQVAKLRGARVLATVGAEWKAELARAAGADEVLVCARGGGGTDFSAWCRELTGGAGVDIVYDGIGKSTYEGSMASLRRRGMLVLFGNASGAVPPIDPLSLGAHGSIFVTRPTLFQYIDGPGEEAARMADVLGWLASGELRIALHDKIFGFGEAGEAHAALESGATSGKILLAPEHLRAE